MNELWDELLAVLQESVELYNGLLLLGEEKRQALIGARAADLDAVTKREELLIIEGTSLEERREKVTVALANGYNISEKSPTLAVIADAAEPDMANQLKECKAELDDAVQRLLRINETNGALIRQALHFVNYNLNLLTQSQVDNTYAPAGASYGPRASVALLDRKV